MIKIQHGIPGTDIPLFSLTEGVLDVNNHVLIFLAVKCLGRELTCFEGCRVLVCHHHVGQVGKKNFCVDLKLLN